MFLGGLALAATAGYVNTVVLALSALPVTHLTGAIARLGMDIGNADLSDAVVVGGLVLAFVLGAAVSGVVIGSATLRVGRRYGIAVMIEAGLLALAAAALPISLTGGAMLAAASAGVQNAMASSYRSLIIRTTHVTGILTDLGFAAGQRLAGHTVAGWRFGLLASLFTAFVLGAVFGAIAQNRWGGDALWLPAVALGVGGAAYFTWRTHARRTLADHAANTGADTSHDPSATDSPGDPK